MSAFAKPLPVLKVLYLRLLLPVIHYKCCICICYTSPSLEGAVSAFATPVPRWKVLYLRLLLPVIGRDLVYVCFSQYFIKSVVSSFDTFPLLEGVVSTFASPSYSFKVVSAFTTPARHWKGLCLRMLHHSLIGRCCICIYYTTPSMEGAVSAFATPVPPLKVLYLRFVQQYVIGMCCINVCFSQ